MAGPVHKQKWGRMLHKTEWPITVNFLMTYTLYQTWSTFKSPLLSLSFTPSLSFLPLFFSLYTYLIVQLFDIVAWIIPASISNFQIWQYFANLSKLKTDHHILDIRKSCIFLYWLLLLLKVLFVCLINWLIDWLCVCVCVCVCVIDWLIVCVCVCVCVCDSLIDWWIDCVCFWPDWLAE